MMPLRTRFWLLGLVEVAAVFRYRVLFANHFHADEALFATWARLIAVWRDPLLQTQSVDKPPLLFYLQALFYPLLGPAEWAARLPGFVASLLLVPLVGLLAWRLYGDETTAVLAAAFVALSPLAIQFSATAFLDPLLTAWLVAALLATAVDRPGWGGVLFGLALLTKYQAALFLPLLLALALLCRWPARRWRRWLMGWLALLALWLVWEAARTGTIAVWSLQVRNFGGTRPIWSWELWPRLWAWLGQTHWLFGGGALAAVFLLGLAALRPRRRDGRAVDALLLLFVAGYFLLHWLLAIPVWDRYLLPLLPLVALLFGRGLVALARQVAAWRPWPQWRTAGAVALLALLLVQLPAAWAARHGRFPIGGQPGADQGAWQVAAYLADAPYGTVLYDHWFSWQWRYHLFDKGVYVSWFPHADALARDLRVFGSGEEARYLALPDAAVARPVLRAVATAGFAPQPVLISAGQPGIVLYRLLPERAS